MNERIGKAVGTLCAWIVFVLVETMFILLLVTADCNLFYRMIISIVAGPAGVYVSTMACKGICKECRSFHLAGVGVYLIATLLALLGNVTLDVKCLMMISLVAFLVAFVLTRKEAPVLNWEHGEKNIV